MFERKTATGENDTRDTTDNTENLSKTIFVEVNPQLAFSTPNASAIATFVECCKPRAIYSKSRLYQRQQVL